MRTSRSDGLQQQPSAFASRRPAAASSPPPAASGRRPRPASNFVWRAGVAASCSPTRHVDVECFREREEVGAVRGKLERGRGEQLVGGFVLSDYSLQSAGSPSAGYPLVNGRDWLVLRVSVKNKR